MIEKSKWRKNDLVESRLSSGAYFFSKFQITRYNNKNRQTQENNLTRTVLIKITIDVILFEDGDLRLAGCSSSAGRLEIYHNN